MISLFEYIIESLINAKELENDLKFIESSKKRNLWYFRFG